MVTIYDKQGVSHSIIVTVYIEFTILSFVNTIYVYRITLDIYYRYDTLRKSLAIATETKR